MSGPRATWKGLLKIALVAVPIKVYPATEQSPALEFHQLHTTCQTRIAHRKWCGHCQTEVPTKDLVKGIEVEPGRIVILSDEDFASVRPESTRVIALTRFAPAATLDPVHIQRSYYLGPDGSTAEEAFAVLRDGMIGQVGIGTLAIYGREYLVAVRPHQGIFVLHTLHHAAEIRSRVDLTPAAVAPLPARVTLAKQVIATLAGPLDLTTFTDTYRAGVQAVIEAKVAGQQTIAGTTTDARPVLPLLDALTQSLALVPPKAKPAPSTGRRSWARDEIVKSLPKKTA